MHNTICDGLALASDDALVAVRAMRDMMMVVTRKFSAQSQLLQIHVRELEITAETPKEKIHVTG